MSEETRTDDGFARTYGMELLFESPPNIDLDAAVSEMTDSLGEVELKSSGNGCTLIYFLDHRVDFEDKKNVPSQLSVLQADMTKDSDTLQDEIQQSWQTQNAEEIVKSTNHKLLVTDFLSSGLQPKQRHKNLSTGLRAIVRSSDCIGLAAKRTQQILSADDFQESDDSLFGFINVRFFNAGENGLVMDTLGLTALGLYDVQCHYQNLDPNDVTRVLYNTAYYIFNEEPQFENGHTISGVNDAAWKVQFEDSLIPPNRVVLDLHPGREFAVGERD